VMVSAARMVKADFNMGSSSREKCYLEKRV
jgi:hypothetical protein